MATLRRRRLSTGEYWYLHWVEPGTGRERKRSIGPVAEISAAQARAILAQKQLELRERGRAGPQAPQLSEWAETYLAWHAKQYPSSHYRVRQIIEQWIVPTLGGYRLDQLTREHLARYSVARDASPATVSKEMRTAQAMMNAAVDWEVLQRNPWRGVRPPQDLDDTPPRYFTVGELERLYEASQWRAHWWRLLANTGLRRKEALQARWEDVHGDVLRVLSTTEARTKAGRSRGVPLNASALEALEGIRTERGGSRGWHADYLLPRMYPQSLSRAFGLDLDAAGLTGSIHDLRHTFCTQLVLAGVHLRKVQLLAGHSRIEITERYSRLLGDDLRDVERIAL